MKGKWPSARCASVRSDATRPRRSRSRTPRERHRGWTRRSSNGARRGPRRCSRARRTRDRPVHRARRAEVPRPRVVAVDIIHAHADDVGDAPGIRRQLLAVDVADDHGAIGPDAQLRTMRLADADALTEAEGAGEPVDRGAHIRVHEDRYHRRRGHRMVGLQQLPPIDGRSGRPQVGSGGQRPTSLSWSPNRSRLAVGSPTRPGRRCERVGGRFRCGDGLGWCGSAWRDCWRDRCRDRPGGRPLGTHLVHRHRAHRVHRGHLLHRRVPGVVRPGMAPGAVSTSTPRARRTAAVP